MSISFQIDHEILMIIASGDLYFDDAIQTRNKAVEILKEKKIFRELIDIRDAVVNISLGSIYSYFQTFYNYYLPAQKHAYVYSPEYRNPELISFSETVSANIGIFTRWFTDIDEARDWLMN